MRNKICAILVTKIFTGKSTGNEELRDTGPTPHTFKSALKQGYTREGTRAWRDALAIWFRSGTGHLRHARQAISNGTQKLQVLYISSIVVHTEGILASTCTKIRMLLAHWTIWNLNVQCANNAYCWHTERFETRFETDLNFNDKTTLWRHTSIYYWCRFAINWIPWWNVH